MGNLSTTNEYNRESFPSDEIMNRNKNWMSELNDNLLLSELSIPGTHDSAANKCGGNLAICQSWTIFHQLNA